MSFKDTRLFVWQTDDHTKQWTHMLTYIETQSQASPQVMITVYSLWKGTKHLDEKLKKLFIIWYKDVLCKRLLGLWDLYIMNKALKIQQQPESRAWLQGHDCAKWQNCEDTRCIIQTVSTSIQWLYRFRLHIYIKCRRNKHLQWKPEVLCDWV